MESEIDINKLTQKQMFALIVEKQKQIDKQHQLMDLDHKQVLEKIAGLENQAEQTKSILENIEETVEFQAENITWIEWLVRPMAIIVLIFAMIVAINSIKGCAMPIPWPGPNPSPIPGPGPQPKPNPEEEKAISICMKANEMNKILTYEQRITWASQEIVRELKWPTDRAADFAREYVTNF